MTEQQQEQSIEQWATWMATNPEGLLHSLIETRNATPKHMTAPLDAIMPRVSGLAKDKAFARHFRAYTAQLVIPIIVALVQFVVLYSLGEADGLSGPNKEWLLALPVITIVVSLGLAFAADRAWQHIDAQKVPEHVAQIVSEMEAESD